MFGGNNRHLVKPTLMAFCAFLITRIEYSYTVELPLYMTPWDQTPLLKVVRPLFGGAKCIVKLYTSSFETNKPVLCMGTDLLCPFILSVH